MLWTGDFELRKLTVSWSRTPTSGVVQDPDMCTFHFLNLTADVPDDTWTTGDYTTVETAFDNFWSAVRVRWSPEVKLSEYSWRADGPAFSPHGGGFSPTLRLTPKSVAGSASTGDILPPQCAMTVTEVTSAHYTAYGVGVPGSVPGTGRTQVRNRWGRFYLPTLMNSEIADGRFTTAACAAVANAVQTMYNACVAADLIPVMYSPTTGNCWSIEEIRVDDLVDVVRSRRYVTPLTRTPRAITAP